MTARRDTDLLIQAFLEEGQTELPDRAYDAVRDEIDHTRQRVVIGPWRVPRIHNIARFAIAAAAIVAVTLVGVNLFPRVGGFGGPGATPTPSPVPTINATKLPDAGDLAPGTYYIDDRAKTQATRFIFTVPAGWSTDDGRSIFKAFDGPGFLTLEPFVVDRIYTDICQWRGADIDVGTTVDELVNALAAQAGHEASAATNVRVGGFAGKRIDLTTPDQEVAFCQGGALHYWPNALPDDPAITGLWGLGNDTDFVYVVSVAGKRLALVARHATDTSAQDVAELEAVVASIRIEP